MSSCRAPGSSAFHMRTWDSEDRRVSAATAEVVTSQVSVSIWICFRDAGVTPQDQGFAPPESHVTTKCPRECPTHRGAR